MCLLSVEIQQTAVNIFTTLLNAEGFPMFNILSNCGICEYGVLALRSCLRSVPNSQHEELLIQCCNLLSQFVLGDNFSNKERFNKTDLCEIAATIVVKYQTFTRGLATFFTFLADLCVNAEEIQNRLGSTSLPHILVDMLISFSPGKNSETNVLSSLFMIESLSSQYNELNQNIFSSSKYCLIYAETLKRIIDADNRIFTFKFFLRFVQMILVVCGSRLDLKKAILDTDIVESLYQLLSDNINMETMECEFVEPCLELLLSLCISTSFASRFDLSFFPIDKKNCRNFI